jgi:flagellar biosynthesis/type III secretory pathway chaperone
MAQQHDSLDALWRWMGEDMISHQALLEEMRQEWGCLKKNDLPSLLPLLQLKEAHMRRIKGHRESIIQIVNGFLGEAAGEDRPGVLSDFLPLVSPSQAQKIKNYQREIERLLRQIASLNEQNKRFIQETLAYLEGIFSLLTSSHREELTYARKGKTVSASLPPCWMSRKV